MSGFVDALLGAQMSGGGIGSGQAKATPVGRSAAAKTPLLSGSGSKTGKGIALVYGELTLAPRTEEGADFCVRTDLASANQGHVGLRAYRLTPNFVEAYRAGRFDTQR